MCPLEQLGKNAKQCHLHHCTKWLNAPLWRLRNRCPVKTIPLQRNAVHSYGGARSRLTIHIHHIMTVDETNICIYEWNMSLYQLIPSARTFAPSSSTSNATFPGGDISHVQLSHQVLGNPVLRNWIICVHAWNNPTYIKYGSSSSGFWWGFLFGGVLLVSFMGLLNS